MMCSKLLLIPILAFCVVSGPLAAATPEAAFDPNLTLDSILQQQPLETEAQANLVSAVQGPGRTAVPPLHVYTQVPSSYRRVTLGEVLSTLAILLFGAVMFAAPTYLSVQLPLDWKRTSGLWFALSTLILACSVLLLIAEYAGQQLAALSGLLGAAAGYILGALGRPKKSAA